MDTLDPQSIRRSCTKFLNHHPPRSARETLAALADGAEGYEPDHYGRGERLQAFEARVAALLGKEAGLFLPSGTMAQPLALRLWAERRGRTRVALHPTSHLELHEFRAHEILHGLEGVATGHPLQLMTAADLIALPAPVGALLYELPQREIGGALPTWDALQEIIRWAQEESVFLHLDGARLWECQPYYGKTYAEICEPFDSVYVSFYKTLGGIAGAMLCGPAEFIATARLWQRRLGGNLVTLMPLALSAEMALDQRLPKIPAYIAKAREIAAALAAVEGIDIVPNPPPANLFHLYLRGDAEKLSAAALALAQETKIWLFAKTAPSPLPSLHLLEITVGDGALELSGVEVAALFARLMAMAR